MAIINDRYKTGNYMKDLFVQYGTTEMTTSVAVLRSNNFGPINVPLYKITSVEKLKDFIREYPNQNIFGYMTIPNSINIAKISYDLYKSPNYWDILLVINEMSPLFDMPYDFDNVLADVETEMQEYKDLYRGGKISDERYEALRQELENLRIEQNENKRVFKYILVPYLYTFIQDGYAAGVLDVSRNAIVSGD